MPAFAICELRFTYSTAKSLHAQLIYFYKSHADRDLKNIGRQLEKLRNARNEADYLLNSFVSNEDARLDYRLALHSLHQIEIAKHKHGSDK
ncbi:hypothetical protein [Paralysiella testudinis]|uniref:hypothetical protein n=1 Tax=Paralysiella testudinis TaxID=2809020 RepID=UPI001E43140B|nr:hypothetical protein [Paralysiella testudinis]